jgi:hypothetical protein
MVLVCASGIAQSRARRGLARAVIDGAKFSARFRAVCNHGRITARNRRLSEARWSQFFLKDPNQIPQRRFLSLPGENAVDKRSNRFTPEGEHVGSRKASRLSRPAPPAVAVSGESIS